MSGRPVPARQRAIYRRVLKQLGTVDGINRAARELVEAHEPDPTARQRLLAMLQLDPHQGLVDEVPRIQTNSNLFGRGEW
ncbi:hypothetical protein LWF01_02765 [Saxibacter everestensis]|uniref:Uncharacterized protein n=1 Tax=Saxibacter everestensis TaxID=2909229 RepID=A0ABY8QX24_9MICO|nr:hypothetical protein LWF01_02765 [Brevibacteriaceae bacterium ZFBP1038]